MFCYSEQITPEEYLALRKTAGWMEFPLEEAADEITLSNDEDGVAEWLADHCLKEIMTR